MQPVMQCPKYVGMVKAVVIVSTGADLPAMNVIAWLHIAASKAWMESAKSPGWSSCAQLTGSAAVGMTPALRAVDHGVGLLPRVLLTAKRQRESSRALPLTYCWVLITRLAVSRTSAPAAGSS